MPLPKKAGGPRKGAGRPKKKRTKFSYALYCTPWEYGRLVARLRAMRNAAKRKPPSLVQRFKVNKAEFLKP